MTTLLISPFGLKVRQNAMVDDLGRAAKQFYRTEAVPAIKQFTNAWATPAVNIKKTETGYELFFSIPGFVKEDVKVFIENDTLKVEGTKDSTMAEGEKILYKEFKHEDFKRAFTLGDKIDADSIVASFENGILKVSLDNKKETAKPIINIEVK
jgi:HSP20 family protein